MLSHFREIVLQRSEHNLWLKNIFVQNFVKVDRSLCTGRFYVCSYDQELTWLQGEKKTFLSSNYSKKSAFAFVEHSFAFVEHKFCICRAQVLHLSSTIFAFVEHKFAFVEHNADTLAGRG